MGTVEEPDYPLLSSSEHNKSKRKTGTIWSAIAHIITALIGAGVLSLGWSIAQLGWLVGPISILIFASLTLLSTFLLCDCYRSPDPEVGGTINRSYIEAVKHFLGQRNEGICRVLVKESLFGVGVAYTITTAVSVRAIQKSNCYQREGQQASCSNSEEMAILLFGCVQVIMSQIPDFHDMKWLSVVATIMSFGYSFIGLGLGISKVIENGEIKGSIRGAPASSPLAKLSLIFQALGDVAFSFPYTSVVLEIQDTLKMAPENQTMKKASAISISIATFFFMFCGCFGYAAFGDDTPGNILTEYGFYQPFWLIDLANACIVAHLVGGYQVYSQPIFASIEGWFARKYSNNGFVNNVHSVKVPLLPTLKVNLLRLCVRTTYVATTTAVALLFPYFNQVLGVLGGLNFWPLAIYFPVEMYLVQKNIDVWSKTGVLLRTFSGACLLVSIVAFIGSIDGLVTARIGNTR